MLKAAIVEDEKILLDDLEELIDWESMGVEVAYTERNGINALRRFTREPVDIIITDIRMPVMSGIEMAQKIREQNRNVQIIFLTGYEEIEYMKSAIEMDAVSYLTKPFQEKEMYDAVKIAAERIELIKNAEIGRRKRMEEELQKYVLRPVVGNADKDSGIITGNETMYTLSLAWIGRFQTITHTRSAVEINWILERVRENLQNFFQYRSKQAIISYINKGQFIIAAEDPEGFIRYGEAEMKELNEGLENVCQIRVISAEKERLYTMNQMHKAYLKICERLKDVFYCDVSPQNHENDSKERLKQRLISDIQRMTETEAVAALNCFFRQTAFEKTERKQVINDCYAICCALIDCFLNKQKAILDNEKRNLSMTLEEFDTLGQIQKYVEQIYRSFVQADCEKGALNDEEYTVRKIIAYIDRHYAEPISAESLADEVYFASNTIRTMFKKQTGSTVHEYLTKVRMENAVELLKNSDKKINQIANAVGYDNVSYFCMRFSKDYGMSPLSYRKKSLRRK